MYADAGCPRTFYAGHGAADTQPASRIPWLRLIPHRETWALLIAKFLTDPIWWFYLYWVPKFLHSNSGIDLGQLAVPLIVIYVAADIGSVFGGWLSSALIKAGWTRMPRERRRCWSAP